MFMSLFSTLSFRLLKDIPKNVIQNCYFLPEKQEVLKFPKFFTYNLFPNFENHVPDRSKLKDLDV